MSVFAYRLGAVEEDQRDIGRRVGDHEREIGALREHQAQIVEQIAGDGGLQKSVAGLRSELGAVRKGFYALTGSILLAVVTLAASIAAHAI